jgi:hypothetical protein
MKIWAQLGALPVRALRALRPPRIVFLQLSNLRPCSNLTTAAGPPAQRHTLVVDGVGPRTYRQ